MRISNYIFMRLQNIIKYKYRFIVLFFDIDNTIYYYLINDNRYIYQFLFTCGLRVVHMKNTQLVTPDWQATHTSYQ